MMRLLKPIAFDVMTCMAQLYDFYMYSVSINCVKAHPSCSIWRDWNCYPNVRSSVEAKYL